MSKYVKNLVTQDLKSRLDGVSDAILVNVIGMDSAATYGIRKHLRDSGVNMLVVKRSMAGRATEGSDLHPMFGNQSGSMAVVWGREDFVSLAKVVVDIVKSEKFAKFELKGGVMDGEAMTAEQVTAASKWPNRLEQISMLVGQILSPGSTLAGQIKGPGAKLASQIKKLVEQKEEGDA